MSEHGAKIVSTGARIKPDVSPALYHRAIPLSSPSQVLTYRLVQRWPYTSHKIVGLYSESVQF